MEMQNILKPRGNLRKNQGRHFNNLKNLKCSLSKCIHFLTSQRLKSEFKKTCNDFRVNNDNDCCNDVSNRVGTIAEELELEIAAVASEIGIGNSIQLSEF
tara:strand:- start:3291 stop:3590 length:300 start_codon:yes stop_codon:yes gene_type:complete